MLSRASFAGNPQGRWVPQPIGSESFMRKQDFHYTLPPELIAHVPLARRSASRLLCIDGAAGSITDSVFEHLDQHLRQGDLLVFNDTRVWPARLYGRKDSGGRVELLLERLETSDCGWFHLGVSKKPAPGQGIVIDGEPGARLLVEARQGALFRLRSADGAPIPELLERCGHVPLPPYIARADVAADRERYQTVYARDPGSAAAPTAGLHFDQELLARLAERGIDSAFLTLHVGAGTFQNLREDDLEHVQLHREWCRVSADTVAQIEQTRRAGGRVVAVGTTVARSLEQAAATGTLMPYDGDTRLFIRPGWRFRAIDALITNFHLPQSSLLMLVCALAGTDLVLRAYAHAVAQRYRFYSYGDACLVLPA